MRDLTQYASYSILPLFLRDVTAVEAQTDNSVACEKMVQLLIAAAEYPKFAIMMRRFAGSDEDSFSILMS